MLDLSLHKWYLLCMINGGTVQKIWRYRLKEGKVNMKTTLKLVSAMTAALLMLTGCGSVNDEDNAGAVQAVSETVTSAVKNAELYKSAESSDSSESENAVKAAETSGGIKITVAQGFENSTRYTPSAEEMSVLVQLAVEQYNAILGRDPDAYFRTLDLRGLFAHGDFKAYRDDINKKEGYEGQSSIFNYTVGFESLLWDKVSIDDPSFATGEYWDECEGDWDEEDPETWTSAEDKTLSAYQQALDSMSADFYRTADPYSSNLAGAELSSEYFYPVYYSDRMESFKPVSSGAVPVGVTLYSSLEFDGGKYIEFSADLKDGGETVHIPHIIGWLKDGESGVSVRFSEETLYIRDRSTEISAEEEQALLKLGMEQYNAIITRDAAGYLGTVNLDKALEGITKEDILGFLDSYEWGLTEGFSIVLDAAAHKDHSLTEPFNNDKLLEEKFDNNQQNAARVWYEAAADMTGDITPELLDETDRDEAIRGDLVSNYFADYDYLMNSYGELTPVDLEHVYTDEKPSAEKTDDGRVEVSMYLRYENGEDKRFLGRLEGFIYEDGSMGVYLCDLIPEDGGEEDYIDDSNRRD